MRKEEVKISRLSVREKDSCYKDLEEKYKDSKGLQNGTPKTELKGIFFCEA